MAEDPVEPAVYVHTADDVDTAVYFDTLDRRLTRGGVTLCRRTGGTDEGWYLALPPDGEGRLEIRRPPGRSDTAVPVALLGLVRAHLRGQVVAPVLAANSPPSSEVQSSPGVPGASGRASAPRGGEALLAEHLDPLVSRLVGLDARVRLEQPAAVLEMLETTLALRGALEGLRLPTPASSSASARDELTWLVGVLEPARDAHVVWARLLRALDEEPAEQDVAPVRRRIDQECGREYRRSRIEVVHALNSRRYLDLLDALSAVVAAVREAEQRRAHSLEHLTHRVFRCHRRVTKAWRASEPLSSAAAASAASERERLRRRRELREAVERARFTAEAVTPAVGKPAARYGEAAAAVQRALEEVRDVAILQERLIAMSTRAARAGEDGSTFARLLAGLQSSAGSAESQLHQARKRLMSRAKRWPGTSPGLG